MDVSSQSKEKSIQLGQAKPISVTKSVESLDFSSNDSEREAPGIGNEGSSKLSSSDSYITSDESGDDEGIRKKRRKFYNLGIKLPNGFLDPLPPLPNDDDPARKYQPKACDFDNPPPLNDDVHVDAGNNVDFSSLRQCQRNDTGDCKKTGYCFPCTGKWISDISECKDLSILILVSYLRREFQSAHFEKVEEKLRVLEEEHIKFQDVLKHVEGLEEELMVYKEIANGNPSSKKDNSLSCEEMILEGLPSELRCKVTGGGGWQCKYWRLQDRRYCQKHHFMMASKTEKSKDKVKKKVKGKRKTKKVAAIKQRGSPTSPKRRRESEHDSDEEKRNYEHLFEKVVNDGHEKPSIPPSPSAHFRREEFLRYLCPNRAFSYTAADGRKSVVAPTRRGTTKGRDHPILKEDRPPHVNICCLVRDAAARLPGSFGTKADVCALMRDSQYVVENVSDVYLQQVVGKALDRLHHDRDPCVQFDGERKLWVYLHRDRGEGDFEDDASLST